MPISRVSEVVTPVEHKSGIYKLYWPGKPYFYVGRSTDLLKRRANHFARLGTGKHANFLLQRVHNKYGEPIFKIIELCSEEKLIEREQYYIDLYLKIPGCFNLYEDAKGGATHLTEVTKEKLRQANLGKKWSEASKAKRNKTITGIGNPNYRHGKLTKEHLSNKEDGRKRGVPVINTATGEIYPTVLKAAQAIGMNYRYFHYQMSGVRNNKTSFQYLSSQNLNNAN